MSIHCNHGIPKDVCMFCANDWAVRQMRRDPFAPYGYHMDAQDNVFVCDTCRQDKPKHVKGCPHPDAVRK